MHGYIDLMIYLFIFMSVGILKEKPLLLINILLNFYSKYNSRRLFILQKASLRVNDCFPEGQYFKVILHSYYFLMLKALR